TKAVLVEMSLAREKMLLGDGLVNVGILTDIPCFVDQNAIGHAMLGVSEASVVRLRIGNDSGCDSVTNIWIRLQIPFLIKTDGFEQRLHAAGKKVPFNRNIMAF